MWEEIRVNSRYEFLPLVSTNVLCVGNEMRKHQQHKSISDAEEAESMLHLSGMKWNSIPRSPHFNVNFHRNVCSNQFHPRSLFLSLFLSVAARLNQILFSPQHRLVERSETQNCRSRANFTLRASSVLIPLTFSLVCVMEINSDLFVWH